MNGILKDLFAFNKRERNGIIILCSLILLVLLIQVLMPLFVTRVVVDNSVKIDTYLKALYQDSISEAEIKIAGKNKKWNKNYNITPISGDEKGLKEKNKWDPINFNPNTAKQEVWEKFGLSKKQIRSILKFLKKGGRFNIKSDVSKMYVIDEFMYLKMKPYILLPVSIDKQKIRSKTNKKEVPVQIDALSIELNGTDTLELKKLKGIGSYYARQIIYYRDKLGGYYSVDQLYEIERMREETVQKILPFIYVDSSKINKIKINSTSASLMVRHPYITWNMAKEIQNYRDFTKKFKSTHQLVEIGLLNEEIYSNLVLYLEL